MHKANRWNSATGVKDIKPKVSWPPEKTFVELVPEEALLPAAVPAMRHPSFREWLLFC